MFRALGTREGEPREDIGYDVILASLVFDFEGVFGEAVYPTFNTSGRCKIQVQEISKRRVICSEQELLAEEEHSEVFDGTHKGVQLHFVRGVIAFRTAEGPRVESYRVLRASIFKALLEDGTNGDTAAVGLEDEVTFRVRKAHDARL